MWHEIYAAAMQATWAIDASVLQMMLSQAKDSVAVEVRPRRKLPRVDGNVAVLPLHGMISQRGSIWQEMFGGTSTEQFGAAFRQAIGDERIKAVIIDVDSPGGTTAGVSELAQVIHEGSQQKEVAAIANSQMASAAYWLASQVGAGKQRLAATPGADVGSIGVFRMHEDVSEAMAAQGVKVTFMATPRFKTEANPFEPLSAAAIDHHMGQVEATYESFVADVARGRGVNKSVVKTGYGEGRMYHAPQAAERGMVDRVATMDKLLSELGAGGRVDASRAATAVLQDELCHAWETCQVTDRVALVDLEARRRRMRLLTKP